MKKSLKILFTGLLTAKAFGDGDFFAYTYDSAGRLTLAVGPTGETISLETGVSGCEEDEYDNGSDPALCVKVRGRHVLGVYAVHQSGRVRMLPVMEKGKCHN